MLLKTVDEELKRRATLSRQRAWHILSGPGGLPFPSTNGVPLRSGGLSSNSAGVLGGTALGGRFCCTVSNCLELPYPSVSHLSEKRPAEVS